MFPAIELNRQFLTYGAIDMDALPVILTPKGDAGELELQVYAKPSA
jgi:hypothetical protein